MSATSFEGAGTCWQHERVRRTTRQAVALADVIPDGEMSCGRPPLIYRREPLDTMPYSIATSSDRLASICSGAVYPPRAAQGA